MTRYPFRRALGAFFLAQRDVLRPLVPAALHPIEPVPDHTILAVTAFDFVDSVVGPYAEVVFSCLVAPFTPRGERMPQAATFPFLLATNTEASRVHAAERWHLPQLPSCLDLRFETGEDSLSVSARDGERPVLDLTVSRKRPAQSARNYQCWTAKDGRLYRVQVGIDGMLDEHEEEGGRLVLHDHAAFSVVSGALESDVPLREQSMEVGEERFGELVPHAGSAS